MKALIKFRLAAIISIFAQLSAAAQQQTLSNKCDLREFILPIDHYSFSSEKRTYKERVFVCSYHYEVGGPLLFYTGNESPVDVYVENTGFLWETGQLMSGLIIFAEHRYYGSSQPFDPEKCNLRSLRYLSGTQAMADYASVITAISSEFKTVGTVVFGGSYGGMLSAWMRVKYPYLVDGAIASSAPVFSFVGLQPPVDDYAFNKHMAKTAGDKCFIAIKFGIKRVIALSESKGGLQLISNLFKTCDPITASDESIDSFISWFLFPWGYYTMGNYPFPSSYMIDSFQSASPSKLPAYPLRVACLPLEDVAEKELLNDDVALLEALAQSISVWYNVTQRETCFFNGEKQSVQQNLGRMSGSRTLSSLSTQLSKRSQSSSSISPESEAFTTGRARVNMTPQNTTEAYNCGSWDFQYCAEFAQPFSGGSDEDYSYPPNKFNLSAVAAACSAMWGVAPVSGYAVREYGNYNTYAKASNIFFANGDQDPWSVWGVDCAANPQHCGKDNDVVSAVVVGGAHHLDLMSSSDSDPQSVRDVRASQRAYIRKWVQQARDAQKKQNQINK